MISRIIYEAVTTFKGTPKAELLPKGINPEAVVIWKYVLKKFRTQIKEPNDLKKQWAIALILFKRQCVAKGIIPFKLIDLEIEKNKEEEKKGPDFDILGKAQRGAKAARKVFDKLNKTLVKDGFTEPTLKSRWVFDKIDFTNGRYNIKAYCKIRVAWDKSNEEFLRNLAMNHKFNKGVKNAFITTNNITTLLFEADPAKKPADKKNLRIIYIFIVISLTTRQAEALTEKEQGTKLETKLTKMGKGILL